MSKLDRIKRSLLKSKEKFEKGEEEKEALYELKFAIERIEEIQEETEEFTEELEDWPEWSKKRAQEIEADNRNERVGYRLGELKHGIEEAARKFKLLVNGE